MIIWQPGQQINNGRFIIQGKPLGSGGFGTTYKALEPISGYPGLKDVQDGNLSMVCLVMKVVFV